MTAGPGVEVRGLERTLSNLKGLEGGAMTALEKSLRSSSYLLHRKWVERLSSRARAGSGFWGPGTVAGPFLGRRSGGTAQRISPGGVLFRRGNELLAPVGSPDRHVAAHDSGATITGNPFLRIPTAAAMTPGGVDRYAGVPLRTVDGLSVIRSRAGKLWIVRASERSVEFLYLLVQSVRLRARGISAALVKDMNAELPRSLEAEARVIARQANG